MALFHFFSGRPLCKMVEKPYVSDKHLHEEIELVFVKSGQVNIQIQGTKHLVKSGQLICIPSNVLHQYLSVSAQGSMAKIKFIKDWLVPAFLRAEEKEICHRLFSRVFITTPNKEVRQTVLSMLKKEECGYQDYYLFGKLIELTFILISKPQLVIASTPVYSESFRYVEEATKYIQDNCKDKVTLKMLADYLGLSESYCSKYIKKNFGISFVQYLSATRVNNAQRLLLSDKNSSITEIAEQTGFFSVQTFNRVFRQQTNQSPSEYRSKI